LSERGDKKLLKFGVAGFESRFREVLTEKGSMNILWKKTSKKVSKEFGGVKKQHVSLQPVSEV